VCLVAVAQPSSDTAPVSAGGFSVDITQPLSLQQCIELAWERHPDVAVAKAEAQAARANAIQQRSSLYPQLVLEWDASHSQSLDRPVNVGGGVVQSVAERRTQRDADVALSYTLYESGRKSRIDRAKTSAVASEYGIADARRLLAYEVSSTYYAILAAHEYAAVTMSSVANAERHRDMVQARVEAGVAPKSDLLPVSVEVSEARLEAVRADTDLAVTYAAFKALLGLPADAQVTLSDVFAEGSYEGKLDALLETAERNRPDVAQQRLSVRAAELGAATAEAEAGVQLSAGVSGDYGRHTGNTGEAWRVSIGATYPLFDAGASQAEVTAARASAQSAQWRLAALMLSVQREVETAHLRLLQAAETIQAAHVTRQDAENSLAAAEARYAEGLAIIVEVTDAQLALLRAQVADVQAQYDYADARAALSKAVGKQITTAAGDEQ